MADVRAVIHECLAGELLPPDTELADDAPLLEVIDSMGILTLVGLVEDELDIAIDADEVSAENFASVNAVTALVESKVRH